MPVDARVYRDNSEMQFNLGLDTLGVLHPAETDAILDVGCGDGRLSIEIAKRVPRGSVAGIDIQASMVALARESASQREIRNISFTCMDVQDIDYISNFEVIFSNFAIPYFPDLKITFRKFFDALKPGGRIIFSSPHVAPDGDIWERDIKALTQIYLREEYRKFLTGAATPIATGFRAVRGLERMLEKCGFIDIKTETKDIVVQFPSLKAYFGFSYLGWAIPTYKIFPADVGSGLLAEKDRLVTEQFEAIPDGQKRAVLTLTFHVFIMAARKPGG